MTSHYFQQCQAIGLPNSHTSLQPDSIAAYWLAECSKLAYADKKTIANELKKVGFQSIKFFDYRGTQAFLAQYLSPNKKFAVLSFRGTAYDFLDIVTDIKIFHSQIEDDGYIDTSNSNPLGNPKFTKGTKAQKPCAHSGFITAMHNVWGNALPQDGTYEETEWIGMSGISNALCQLPDDITLYVTGHSLGGAIATLAAYHAIPYLAPNTAVKVYTFGAPRVSNQTFAQQLNQRLKGEIYRFVNRIDIVPRIPFSIPPFLNYTHSGNLILFKRRGVVNIFSDYPPANTRFSDRLSRWLMDGFVYLFAPVDLLIGSLNRYLFYKPKTTKAHEIDRYCHQVQRWHQNKTPYPCAPSPSSEPDSSWTTQPI